MIQHKCEDPECIYLGQPTAQSCKCHRTSDQMMAARIEALEAEVASLREANQTWADMFGPRAALAPEQDK
jgi:hypothetical protein